MNRTPTPLEAVDHAMMERCIALAMPTAGEYPYAACKRGALCIVLLSRCARRASAVSCLV